MANKDFLCCAGHFAAASGLSALILFVTAGLLFGQVDRGASVHLASGKEIFKSACVACHGSDGSGAPQSTRGFELPRTFPRLHRLRSDYSGRQHRLEGGDNSRRALPRVLADHAFLRRGVDLRTD